MSIKFDVIVIGAGPGGYISAIRAAQLGMSVACVDNWENSQGGAAPGGTCTNVGCIPSKALLHSSEYFEKIKHLSKHGIEIDNLKLNIDTLIGRKDSIIKQNNDGILHLLKKNKVTFFHGKASFLGKTSINWSIKIENVKTGLEKTVSAKHIIIATGSLPRKLPSLPFDEKLILSNDGALRLNNVPSKLCIVGGGVIGLEMGSVWRRLGSQVTILESMTEFLPGVDRQVAEEAFKIFSKQGLDIELKAKIEDTKIDQNSVSINYFNSQNKLKNLAVDKVIVSIGRVPNIGGLNDETVGLSIDENNFIIVDENCKTNLSNVWAIGDVVRGPMLAHKSEEEGIAVSERIAGQHTHVNFATIPWVIYTSPEIAWVGKNEQQLNKEGRKYKVGKFPFLANGRARVLDETSGFAKVISDFKTDEILGVHIIGPLASELIAEAVAIMEFRGASEDIARICHAHPTLSEVLKEAALGVEKRSLNF
ncbi:MAG: dihydrolipoyl dehydrogenase [Bordetella sp.]|nr:MAG: dihydrolipoyl dehydrogenase [Bordetella sp.]